jgi:hypothetical protein
MKQGQEVVAKSAIELLVEYLVAMVPRKLSRRTCSHHEDSRPLPDPDHMYISTSGCGKGTPGQIPDLRRLLPVLAVLFGNLER